ncbi:MAG: DUF4856 domain-containing protein [Flavobacteriaceae bacterium]|jgi:hypothetical protein|nr:DUF4856 domain-containing protein [Flavobacteriaceae bacterium]
MKNLNLKSYLYIASIAILFSSCSKEDDVQYITETITETVVQYETETITVEVQVPIVTTVQVEIPYSYEFARAGKSTVSYSGQTSRLNMADELYAALNTNTFTKAQMLEMFNDGTGFADATLNSSGKKMGNKTAGSPLASATVKPLFDAMITDFADNVIPNWATDAANGQAGVLTDVTRTIHVNAKGHEIDQTFIKGIIGAMNVDQIINNYITPYQLDSGTRTSDNDNNTLSSGKDYTDMEHKWDEGFGYLYGQEADATRLDLGLSPTGNGTTLNKYFKKINASNQVGIGIQVFDAFRRGRAFIVAKQYDKRDQQAKIIKEELSKVIAYKAVDYINGYMSKIEAGNTADAFHALSEAYGFVMSLQFTNDGTDSAYFSNSEVNGFLTLMDNFWTVQNSDLESIRDQVKAKFGI